MKATSRFNEPLPNLYRNLDLLQQRPEKSCRVPSWQVAALRQPRGDARERRILHRSLEISPAVVAVHRHVGHRNPPHLALVSDANDLRGVGTAAPNDGVVLARRTLILVRRCGEVPAFTTTNRGRNLAMWTRRPRQIGIALRHMPPYKYRPFLNAGIDG